MLQVKLDGYIEACVLAARQQNIGLKEALHLTCAARMREFAAHGRDREKVRLLLLQAWEQACPDPASSAVPRIM
jgi:hypothetical protein